MEVKEFFLALSEADEVFNLIQEEIANNENVQVFVERSLIDEFRENSYEHRVYPYSGSDGYCHYDKDVTWYRYCTDDSSSPEDWIVLASFISNCKGYYQLVGFLSEKVEERYRHYFVGFEKLVLIHKK